MRRTGWACIALLFFAVAAHSADSPDTYVRKGMAAYQAENYPESWQAFEKAIELGETSAVIHYNAACSLALDGRKDRAFEHMFAAVEGGYADADYVAADPDLNLLHDDSRWSELLEQMRNAQRQKALRWGGAAFKTEYRENLSDAEKVAGLSRVWAEAKFGFANFDQVRELDWDARYIEFIDRVKKTGSTRDYYLVLMEFIAALKDGHTNVYPPRELWQKMLPKPGFHTGLIENRVIIREVGHPSAIEAGFRAGQEILAINGEPIKEYAEREVRPYQSASTPQDLDVRVYDYRLLGGDPAEKLVLRVRDPDGTVRDLAAPRLSRETLRAMSPETLELDWLPDGIAHVRLNSFSKRSVVEAFEAILPEVMARAGGLILDVRDNGGGSSSFGYDILAYLTEESFVTTRWELPRYVATYRAWEQPQGWEGPDEQSWSGTDNAFAGPVAILIGPRTYSAAEDFAVAFDQMERGVLVGEATGGSTGQPLIFDLPGGGKARICTKRDRYADGTEFVGVGVQPDIVARTTVAAIRSGEDPAVAAALEWMGKQ